MLPENKILNIKLSSVSLRLLVLLYYVIGADIAKTVMMYVGVVYVVWIYVSVC